MEQPIDAAGDRMAKDAVEQPAMPPGLGHAVAMDRQRRAACKRNPELVRREADPQLLLPEGVAPAVVVSAGHRHRHGAGQRGEPGEHGNALPGNGATISEPEGEQVAVDQDRKSTRLNSSHLVISYAVFCLEKKK